MYILKMWNSKWDDEAKFIVLDKKSGKYTELNCANPNDLAWVNKDLTKLPEYKDWESFEDTPVDDLTMVTM